MQANDARRHESAGGSTAVAQHSVGCGALNASWCMWERPRAAASEQMYGKLELQVHVEPLR